MKGELRLRLGMGAILKDLVGLACTQPDLLSGQYQGNEACMLRDAPGWD